MGWDVCRKVFCGVLHSGRGQVLLLCHHVRDLLQDRHLVSLSIVNVDLMAPCLMEMAVGLWAYINTTSSR